MRQAKAVGVFDDHDGGVRNVDADFDDRGCDQHVDLAALEFAHDVFFFVRVEAAVQQADVQVGKNLVAQLAEHLLSGLQFAFFILFDDWIDDVGLMTGSDLFAEEIPYFQGALVGDVSRDNRRATGGKFVEDGDVEVAVERQSQSPRDGGRGHYEYVRLRVGISRAVR